MTPPLAASLPRKMFSAIDSSGMSASSWWMMTMPACSLSRMLLNSHQLAVEVDLAVVGAGRVHARQDLHQGGLAGAVLPADRVDLAAANRHRDVRERLDARELLGDVAHLEDDAAGRVRRDGPRRRSLSALDDPGAGMEGVLIWSSTLLCGVREARTRLSRLFLTVRAQRGRTPRRVVTRTSRSPDEVYWRAVRQGH